MKHLAKIQSEFSKVARKWDDLSLDEQKSYLKRHPKTKRKITARPDNSKIKSDPLKTKPAEKSTKSIQDFFNSLSKKTTKEIKNEIDSLEEKMQKRTDAASNRERNSRRDFDGMLIERAWEKNQPLQIKQDLMKHYLEKGNKKVPKELQEDFDRLQEEFKVKNERKQKVKSESEDNSHLIGKTITWESRKFPGKVMKGVVVSVRAGKYGPLVKTDTGWKVPVSFITNSKGSTKTKEEIATKLVKAKDLIGLKIKWKTKKKPGMVRKHNFAYERKVPGYDAKTSTASGTVSATKGSKVIVEGWGIPLGLIQEVNDKKFDIKNKNF